VAVALQAPARRHRQRRIDLKPDVGHTVKSKYQNPRLSVMREWDRGCGVGAAAAAARWEPQSPFKRLLARLAATDDHGDILELLILLVSRRGVA
jgi:hypothetical protein